VVTSEALAAADVSDVIDDVTPRTPHDDHPHPVSRDDEMKMMMIKIIIDFLGL